MNQKIREMIEAADHLEYSVFKVVSFFGCVQTRSVNYKTGPPLQADLLLLFSWHVITCLPHVQINNLSINN